MTTVDRAASGMRWRELEDRAVVLPPRRQDVIDNKDENRARLRQLAQARRQVLEERRSRAFRLGKNTTEPSFEMDKAASLMRWRDLKRAEDLAVLLPPCQVVGPGENNVKKVIAYMFDEDGNKVKVTTTTTRVSKLAEARQAVDRREWVEFRDEARMVSTQPIPLERELPPGSKEEDLLYVATPIMVCTNCSSKSDHWSASCRLKFKPPQGKIEWPNASYYAPPNMRTIVERPPGSEVRPRNEENSVRVSNLYAWAREADLIDMLGSFGWVSCVYVAIDQKTDLSKGYGFLTFVEKEAVERAIAEVNGQWYHNHMIRVEPWNKVRN